MFRSFKLITDRCYFIQQGLYVFTGGFGFAYTLGLAITLTLQLLRTNLQAFST